MFLLGCTSVVVPHWEVEGHWKWRVFHFSYSVYFESQFFLTSLPWVLWCGPVCLAILCLLWWASDSSCGIRFVRVPACATWYFKAHHGSSHWIIPCTSSVDSRTIRNRALVLEPINLQKRWMGWRQSEKRKVESQVSTFQMDYHSPLSSWKKGMAPCSCDGACALPRLLVHSHSFLLSRQNPNNRALSLLSLS